MLICIAIFNILRILAARKTDGQVLTTSSAGNVSEDGNEMLYHVLVQTTPAYSHCLENYGIALTLVESGTFQATIFVAEPCQVLATRMLEATQYPDRIRLQVMEMSSEPKRALEELMTQFVLSTGFTNAGFFMPTQQTFAKIFNVSGESFRRDNFSVARQIHQKSPFHAAICDGFSPACFEFADQQGIVGISAAVQGPPSKRDIEHNGLWLVACPRKSHCSLLDRVASFYDYFVPFNLPFFRPRMMYDVTPMMREIFVEARCDRSDIPPLRTQYPFIDQQVLGTNKPAAYYRTDHVIVGPTWFGLYEQKLNASHSLTAWIERANKPIVYVSFGTVAHLGNKTELAIILGGIVSTRWQTIWKANAEVVREILNDKATGVTMSDEIWSLAGDTDTLHVIDWVPQYALLRHPKLKVFVTHGGMSSLMEASANGVPMICIPFFCDQPYNCDQCEATGTSILIPKTEVTSKKLHDTIERVLFDGHALASRAAKVAQYHATVNTARRVVEFVSHYAQFGYQFSEIAEDNFDWITYWNVDFWAPAGAIAVALAAVVVALICKCAKSGKKMQRRDGEVNSSSKQMQSETVPATDNINEIRKVGSSNVISSAGKDKSGEGGSSLRRRREQ